MTQLKKFTFCINTEVFNDEVRVELSSNEDIQRSFIGRGYQQVTSSSFSSILIYISNGHAQQDKQRSSTFLNLQYAHVDYAELFLLQNNAHLPRLLNLRIEYESLTTITNNFTNNVTYFNFDRLRSLDVCQPFVRPEKFHQYFPLL
ncbi:unnamed protein product [Rotaria socialis]|uniref:Uncharacterized protein n=1 Tax=Rotaria socialis TaxID=392032 RepID=A0A820M6T9_9BILA|nr:unnamed protein product [Rotaria socialis]CAF3588867.1 unnamed protein product [Rotaria socialis]CAF4367703.1 unnamed protein product [Rotaria socialis]CAF4428093.1 unnamed protein product [Rotaria socialis]